MNEFEEQFSKSLGTLASQTDVKGVDRALLGAANRNGRPTVFGRRFAMAAGFATVAVAATLAGVVGLGSSSGDKPVAQQRPTDNDIISPTVREGEPCAQAKNYTLDELARIAGAPIWMPNSPLASAKALTGAWTCLGGNEPLLTFNSGVQISYEPGWSSVDPKQHWSEMIDQTGLGRLGTVLGQPALIYDVSKEALKGQVLVVEGDTLIRVTGDGNETADQLADVAESIDVSQGTLSGR